MYIPGSATCSSKKHPNPDRFDVIEGTPMTVHSATKNIKNKNKIIYIYNYLH